MPKWFHTAGPGQPDIHYMLPPLARLPNLERLIAQWGYFAIHAPRQTGQITAMLALAQQLTASGQYAAIPVSAEVGAPCPYPPYGVVAGASAPQNERTKQLLARANSRVGSASPVKVGPIDGAIPR
jgi:hypothetical protein